ncbi:hypothetical protein JCM33374_g4929 [Metschnikowia sp. JCM 33374]|nr:hypothetical protein JCM33374_g4929 [Metschnikowia sp. JCM 33374]
MSFKLRSEHYGLSSSGKNSLRESQAQAWKHVNSGSAVDITDEFDDDAEIDTPHSLRETSRPFVSNGTLSKSSSSAFLRRTESPDIPQTPIRGRYSDRTQSSIVRDENSPDAHTVGLSRAEDIFNRSASAATPKRKLVGADNSLTPGLVTNGLSPPRMDISTFDHSSIYGNDMEFDSSDHDSPDKRKQTAKRSQSQLQKKDNAGDAVDVYSESRVRGNNYIVNEAKYTDRTPRRSSPLRNEVLPSSSMKSTASDMLDEIRRSGALKPRTVEEIQEQIESSIIRLEQSSSGQASESESNMESSASQGESDNDDILEELEQYIPAEFKHRNSQSDEAEFGAEQSNSIQNREVSPPPQDEDQSPPISQPSISELSRVDLNVLPKDSSPIPRVKRKRVLRTGKLSGKYARKLIKDNKKRAASKKYGDWSSEQWEKLKQLVESDVPNSVIANSDIVMKELKCNNKQELAQRVKFLESTRR